MQFFAEETVGARNKGDFFLVQPLSICPVLAIHLRIPPFRISSPGREAARGWHGAKASDVPTLVPMTEDALISRLGGRARVLQKGGSVNHVPAQGEGAERTLRRKEGGLARAEVRRWA